VVELIKREWQHCNLVMQNLTNMEVLVATQWRFVTCLFRKAASCGPLALYKLATMSIFDRKGGLFFLNGCWMVVIWTKQWW
jgi:hypothetical protein